MILMYFGPDDNFDLSNKSRFKERLEDIKEELNKGNYVVILHNDPINGVDFVTKVIKEVFGYSTRKAIWLMLKAHFTGSSQLWIGAEVEALKKRNQMVLYGADPNVSYKDPSPLTVSVERADK